MTELGLLVGLGLLGLAFAAYLARWVMARPIGEPDMARIAGLVRRAAEAFFRRQSGIIGAVSAALGGAIFLAYGLLRRAGEGEAVSPLELGVWLTVSFAVGAVSAVAVGHVSVWIATRANVRAASAARRSLDQALQVAIRGGAVSGLFLVATAVLGVAALFAAVFAYKGGFGREPGAALKLVPTIPMMLAGHALGASFAGLLAELGAGTFAKAVDLAADIGGREAGLGEDDAENPATIADLAGDDVGDCGARAIGLFQSTVAENLAAMWIGGMLSRENPDLPSVLAITLFPIVTRGFGLIGAMFGVMVVRTDDREDPMSALSRGLYVTALLHGLGLAGAAKWLLGTHWMPFFACGAIGIATGIAMLFVVQHYTEQRNRPLRELAEAARGGPALAILAGFAAALESTVAPLLLTASATLGAYTLGAATGLQGGGLFGVAVATMGMLGTSGYVFAMSAFGAIADNAGGIVEMTVARERPDVRGRTLVLDGVGNTAKALAKTYAAAAAVPGSLLLVSAFLAEAHRRAPGAPAAQALFRADAPEVYFAAFAGIVLVAWFASRCLAGVARVARRLIDEVRRQLRDRPTLLARSSRGSDAGRAARGDPAGVAGARSAKAFVPNHEEFVENALRSSLREMFTPALVAAAAPIVVGLALRLARTEDNRALAADSVAAFVVAGTVAGVVGSLLLGNAGGAWDNAKKYIVTGAHGGRYLVDETGDRTENPTYGAAAVGDSVGDPLKDAVGPALLVLAKMLNVITLVFLPFFL